MGSTTLFKAVFINPEQVVRFYACSSCGYEFCKQVEQAGNLFENQNIWKKQDKKQKTNVILGEYPNLKHRFAVVLAFVVFEKFSGQICPGCVTENQKRSLYDYFEDLMTVRRVL